MQDEVSLHTLMILPSGFLSETHHRQTPSVFMLWGNDARLKAELVENNQVIQLSHPSNMGGAYNKSFKDSGQFRKVNAMLSSPLRWGEVDADQGVNRH